VSSGPAPPDPTPPDQTPPDQTPPDPTPPDPTPPDPTPPDPTPPGLSAERTRLAWRRTTLSVTAVLVLAASRTVTGGGRPLAVAMTSTIALLWLTTLAVAHRRLRALRALPSNPRTATRAPVTLALLVAVLAVAGALLVA
jgi:hypothetical protein